MNIYTSIYNISMNIYTSLYNISMNIYTSLFNISMQHLYLTAYMYTYLISRCLYNIYNSLYNKFNVYIICSVSPWQYNISHAASVSRADLSSGNASVLFAQCSMTNVKKGKDEIEGNQARCAAWEDRYRVKENIKDWRLKISHTNFWVNSQKEGVRGREGMTLLSIRPQLLNWR